MPTITVKNIPDDLYERLKQLAKVNRRSINSEIIVCIERSVYSHSLDPDEVLAKARILREKTSQYPISDEELNQAKTSGRL
jgi:antitoxin FitA